MVVIRHKVVIVFDYVAACVILIIAVNHESDHLKVVEQIIASCVSSFKPLLTLF